MHECSEKSNPNTRPVLIPYHTANNIQATAAAGHRPRPRPIAGARTSLLAPPWAWQTFLSCPSKGPPKLLFSPPQPLPLPCPSSILPDPLLPLFRFSLFLNPPIDDLVDCLRAFDLILRGPRSSALLSTPPPPFCFRPIEKVLRKKKSGRIKGGCPPATRFCLVLLFFRSSISVSFYCLFAISYPGVLSVSSGQPYGRFKALI